MYFSIEGHWETINSLRDISRIVREYYNSDLANELDDLIEVQEDEIKRLGAFEWQSYNEDLLMDEIDDLESEIRCLKRKIVELEGMPNGL